MAPSLRSYRPAPSLRWLRRRSAKARSGDPRPIDEVAGGVGWRSQAARPPAVKLGTWRARKPLHSGDRSSGKREIPRLRASAFGRIDFIDDLGPAARSGRTETPELEPTQGNSGEYPRSLGAIHLRLNRGAPRVFRGIPRGRKSVGKCSREVSVAREDAQINLAAIAPGIGSHSTKEAQ